VIARRPPRVGSVGLLLAACGLLLAACGQPTAAQPTPSPSTSSRTPAPAETTASVAPAPTPKALYSPLTGVQVPALNQVLVVKVDNTRSARPQAGVTSADVVYVEEVEGGVTRLAAVFSSTLPSSVGPIRSARTTDIELLAQDGSVTLAYSGANDGVQEELTRSGLRLLNDDHGAPGFRRERGRPRVFDLMGDPAAFLAASRSLPARDVGFRFGTPAPGGKPVGSITASYPNARIGATWDGAAGRWTMSLDGRAAPAAEGGNLSAATVVVQYVDVEDSGYVDIVGSRTPLVRTVGTGPAVVLRDGLAYDGTWNRPFPQSRTTFAGADGAPIPFAPGPVWVLLVNKANPIAVAG
jgi:Protein of unknown function (DUF3048) N-terminal domain/Protein of unknown function (DUF3048) C-terminal domain